MCWFFLKVAVYLQRCPTISSTRQSTKIYQPIEQTQMMLVPVMNLPSAWKTFKCELLFANKGESLIFRGVRTGTTEVTCNNVRISVSRFFCEARGGRYPEIF